MEQKTKKQPYTAGQIFGMIGIVLLLSPMILRGFLLFFGVPVMLLGLVDCDIFVKISINHTLWSINVGAALYVTIWISAKMWPKRKELQLEE